MDDIQLVASVSGTLRMCDSLFTRLTISTPVKRYLHWWIHKLPWILPSLIKSCSQIDPANWDITDTSTNLNEGQHHWANPQTGVKLTILEAIEIARKVDFKMAREVKDSLETGLLNNNSNNMLHMTAEADELQAWVDATKAAKKVTDQAVKDVQTALSAAKGTSTRRKSGKATIPALPFIDPSPAPAPVDFALPFDFGDDLAWLDNLGFLSETPQPLDASLNNVSLINTVPNDNPGGTEFQFDANGKLDWFFASVFQGGGDFNAPSSQLDRNARGPDSLDPSSSTGTGDIDFEGWDTDIVSTESEVPILLPPPRRPHTRLPLLCK
ncbi:hypothetical protein DFH08DRAFT_931145 [Mycena albidolilacea]|uniref:Uncharacterized protein n=1 Tax=Mycena albidolilacea TaxID=1033008 RepID=A0AAD7F211_9AGAR|nr:hypothetical protein DFH08DRAFT_931145 [Mycena albidolilacea]